MRVWGAAEIHLILLPVPWDNISTKHICGLAMVFKTDLFRVHIKNGHSELSQANSLVNGICDVITYVVLGSEVSLFISKNIIWWAEMNLFFYVSIPLKFPWDSWCMQGRSKICTGFQLFWRGWWWKEGLKGVWQIPSKAVQDLCG